MSDTYTVERSTTIAAAPDAVFAKVSDLTQWDDWSPWAEMDASMQTEHTGEPSSVGQHYAWSGNRKVGEGTMTITGIDAPNQVDLDLEFLKPFKSRSDVTWLVEAEGDATKVTWKMTGANNFMIKVMSLIGRSMDKTVGPDFEKGLANLKRVIEA